MKEYMQRPPFPFQFIGNDLVLDFVNTRIGVEGEMHDLIETPGMLASWLSRREVDFTVSHWSEADFKELQTLRDAIWQTLQNVTEGAPPETSSVAKINKHLKDYTLWGHLGHDDKGYRLQKFETAMSPHMFMAHIAKLTVDLLTQTDRKRIRRCADPKCVLLFKDISKGGRRKWCRMETCGNRRKAANFRESKKFIFWFLP